MPTGSTDISNGPPGLSVRLDVRHVPILVVGGGRVAARRVNALREAGADRVTVVATRFAENFRCDVDRITAAFDPAHLENIRLAFAATDDPAVNDHVCQSCVRRNIWCNRADRAEAGDLQMPLAWRQGTIAVTVSTGSPHLSRALAGLIRPVIAEWEDLRVLSFPQAPPATIEGESVRFEGRLIDWQE